MDLFHNNKSKQWSWSINISLYAMLRVEFGRKLEDDLIKETSGHFRRLLVAQCNADRDHSKVADFAKAHKDAKDIYEVIVTCAVL